MRWFVRGDIDGFFGLALDNLVQVLLLVGLCGGVLGFPAELIYGRMLPAIAISLVVGNVFYAWQAKRLAARTGRTDICALPYGINTVSLIAHVFLVMLPVKLLAKDAGMSDAEAAMEAWKAGLVACLGSGLIEFFGSFIAQTIRRITPRAALLSTLAGIAIGLVSMGFVFRTFAHPEVGIITLGIILLTYFGGVRFKGGLPGGFVAIAVGTAIAWALGIAPNAAADVSPPRWLPPVLVLDDLWAAVNAGYFVKYLAIILPMGLFNLLGSLQNIESAEAAGDSYPTAPSLAVNGLGTILAAAFGSPFPTTIYIGHPGWKGLGARAGYSILNAVFFAAVCLTGVLGVIHYVIPIDAGMAIVLYIGIVIAAQAFQAVPKAHAPAVVVGLLPGLAAWGTLLTMQALRAAGYGTPEKPISPDLLKAFWAQDNWIDGAFALNEGFILTSMILSAVTVCIIERDFRRGSAWATSAAAFSAVGLMHSYSWTPAGPAMALGKGAWGWVIGYLAVAILLFAAPWITEPGADHETGEASKGSLPQS